MKKILQVRFVNFGDEICFCYQQTLFCEEGFDLYGSPLLMGESWHRREKRFIEKRAQFDEWIETLNSGERKVPRIERSDEKGEERYAIFTTEKYVHFSIGKESLQALNQIYGKEAEIYEPKTIKPDWKQIYPREIKPYEICFDKTVACDDCVRRADRITALLQTESGGLEVHELIVYEV